MNPISTKLRNARQNHKNLMSNNYHTKTPIDISSFKGTVKVLKPRNIKRHYGTRIKCAGVPRMSWAAMIKEARKVS
jgi:hypothetical protein